LTKNFVCFIIYHVKLNKPSRRQVAINEFSERGWLVWNLKELIKWNHFG